MSDDVEYGLVMPFVVCATNGGPYDDAAFVAGYAAGTIDYRLSTRDPLPARSAVRTDLLPQLDLIAMRHGYTMTSEPWGEAPAEWTMVTFTREPDEEPGKPEPEGSEP